MPGSYKTPQCKKISAHLADKYEAYTSKGFAQIPPMQKATRSYKNYDIEIDIEKLVTFMKGTPVKTDPNRGTQDKANRCTFSMTQKHSSQVKIARIKCAYFFLL